MLHKTFVISALQLFYAEKTSHFYTFQLYIGGRDQSGGRETRTKRGEGEGWGIEVEERGNDKLETFNHNKSSPHNSNSCTITRWKSNFLVCSHFLSTWEQTRLLLTSSYFRAYIFNIMKWGRFIIKANESLLGEDGCWMISCSQVEMQNKLHIHQ